MTNYTAKQTRSCYMQKLYRLLYTWRSKIPSQTDPSFGGFTPLPFLILLLRTPPSLISDTSSPVTTNTTPKKVKKG